MYLNELKPHFLMGLVHAHIQLKLLEDTFSTYWGQRNLHRLVTSMLGKCRDPDGTTMVPPANLFQRGRAPYCALQLVWLNLLTPRSKGKHFYPRFFPPRLSL